MKILFSLGHPAHYHLFKNLIIKFIAAGHKVIVVIRPKDVLEQLCQLSEIPYIKLTNSERGNGYIGIFTGLLKKIIKVHKIVKEEKPDLLIGSDSTLAFVGFLNRIPSFELTEDDAKAVKLYSIISYPFFSNIVSPSICNAWKWEYKKIGYNGYHELSYLSPKYFTPDKKRLRDFIDFSRPYFIIRLSALNAYHDKNVTGIIPSMVNKLIALLTPYGNIYISSEGKLVNELEKYRIRIDADKMHDALYYASLFIGDSQTMAAEAAVLGTPSLRYNDFVGRLSYLEELEHKYGLTYGTKPSEPEKLVRKIEELLKIPDLKQEWNKRKNTMLSEKIDVTAFLAWFVENYPESVKVMKDNPDYQYNFR